MSLREHNINRAKLLVISKFICEVRNVFRANAVKDKQDDKKEIRKKHKHFVLRKLKYWRISHLTRKQQWDDDTGLNNISLLSSHWQVYPISARHAVKTKWKRLFVNGCKMEEKDFYSGGIFELVSRDRADGSAIAQCNKYGTPVMTSRLIYIAYVTILIAHSSYKCSYK
jgi:hypothetical protein